MFKTFRNKIREFKEFSKEREYFNKVQGYHDHLAACLEQKTFLPSMHIVKQNNIHEYREKYQLNILVETGTYLGDMVEAQKRYFNKVYSIELSNELYSQAVDRFGQDSNVEIILGDSGQKLKELLEIIKEPALFWLDGHYSAGFTAKGNLNTPIIEELRTVLTNGKEHVILIDDARLFTGEDDYPSIFQLCSFVNDLSPERKVIVADDIIRITP